MPWSRMDGDGMDEAALSFAQRPRRAKKGFVLLILLLHHDPRGGGVA